jgi:hypothetical protein
MAAVALVSLLAAATAAVAAEPTADEIWFQFRDAYAGLAGYHDIGEIERVDSSGTVRFRFRTDLEGDGELRFSFQPEGGEPTSLSARADGKPSASSSALAFAAALDSALGAGAAEALRVPGLLVAGPLSPPDPAALALDGVEPCGEERCRVLAGARPEAGLSFRLWVGERDHLLRRSEVEIVRVEDAGERRGYRVTLRPVAEPRAPDQVFSETVTVELSSIDVRVIDDRGKAVPGLVAADFRLRLGRDELPIEAVEWVGELVPDPDDLAIAEPPELDEVPDDWEETAPPAGRLVLFFVQANLDPQRNTTEMKVRGPVRSFVDGLPLSDRVAVVSFDSHLKLRLDFTEEREAIHEALDASWRTGPALRLDRSGSRRRRSREPGEPSLAESLDRAAAERASTPERALELAARALVPLEGEKLVVFLGWGLGERGLSGVVMPAGYDEALRALDAARASVFVLDVSDAASHSLEVGLRKVAHDTGGTYVKTSEFPALAAARIEEAISGHYLVYFNLPEGAKADRLRLELRDGRHRELLVRRTMIRAKDSND